ncbi:hypothetical protein JNUCC1_01250 [Lentibacillus sp. JNUCC-1]|nr:hypothetical protein [Lentibacillus sp. JNUCC-1]MUV37444.1 hypothetical protein [Lentibacillus sp. JNUCC-1]
MEEFEKTCDALEEELGRPLCVREVFFVTWLTEQQGEKEAV